MGKNVNKIMKIFLRYFVTGLKYLIIQGIIEIVIIVLLEYLGFNALLDFSRSNLFVENIEGVAWAISMKTAIFSLIYLPLFAVISFLLAWKKVTSKFKFSIINALLSIALLLILFLLKHLNFSEMLPPLMSTLIASLIIILFVNSKGR